MTNSIKIQFILLSLFCSVFTACSQDDDTVANQKSALQNLSGTYASTAPEDWGNGTYGTRTFTFDNGKWTLRFALGLDPGMNVKVFEFRTFGTYKVLEPSATVPGAFNALFYEEKKFVTLRTGDAGLTAAFGLAVCGLEKDVEKDISATGCAIWPSVADCNEDHDLLSLDASGQQLFFGVRPAANNMCTADRRPTALLPAVVKK